jgi:hypothetical protein
MAESSTPRETEAPPTAQELADLDALIARSVWTATPAVAESVAYSGRQMSAAELIAFWRDVRLVAMATVGAKGQPHIAPVHARLTGTVLRLVIYDNTVRRRDLEANPRVAFTGWGAGGGAVILYGRAHEVPGSLRESRSGRSGAPRRVVSIEVRLTRVYAMKAPERAVAPGGAPPS